ncbi:clarin-3 [Gracilinanus agilis]|uniref:clarin-3 n=1 Tax=Gracilinanus agilis TaxID=191870 RepID=UPI001CFD6469|nr:clarin-3 [Gracilinanus agilis]
MPTAQKTLLFLSGFVSSLGSFVTLCVVLAIPRWVTARIEFDDGRFSNGSVTVTYGLFRGETSQDLTSGLGQSDQAFEVLKILPAVSPRSLHLVVIAFLFLGLFTSLLSSGLTLFNAVSNPYQTWLGPTSIFVWNGLNMTLTVLAMVQFAVNAQANGLSRALCSALYAAQGYTYGPAVHQYEYPFWLLLLVLFFNVGTVVVVVFYQNARYQRKQERRKPLENAPRDGILF